MKEVDVGFNVLNDVELAETILLTVKREGFAIAQVALLLTTNGFGVEKQPVGGDNEDEEKGDDEHDPLGWVLGLVYD